jgi:hypothetical protein
VRERIALIVSPQIRLARAAACTRPTSAHQGPTHLMTVLVRAVDATFAAFGVDAVYTGGGELVSVRVVTKRPDRIVGFG